jgi:phosphoserine phosphatase RsbU/P
MANLQAFLKTISRQGLEMEAATALLNDLVSENTSDGKFITFFWALLDDTKKKMTYVNAGHNPPLLIRNRRIIKLEKGGIILGVTKTFLPYESETIELKTNDVLILFTDGVTEAMNTEEEEFSDAKLEFLVVKLSEKQALEILNSVRDEINSFTNGAPQSDDITLIALKVK